MENNMPETYEPDSRFVERLEWQLASEYRRLDRMTPSGKITIPRPVAVITAMVAVLMTGVAAIKAADYIKDSWRKKIELARAETEVELNRARLESVRELAGRTEELFSNRMVQQEEYLSVTLGVEKAGLALERSLLNLDEVKASGLPPRDELYAPLVDGRDFVSERLGIEVKQVEADLKLLTGRRERVQELVAKAVVSGEELSQIQAAIDARKAMIDEIRKRLDLRKRFVSGEITVQEVEIMGRMAAAKGNMNQAQAKVDFLKKELERLQTLEAKGTVSPLETGQLRYGLEAAQAELRLAALEVDILEKAK
jgi:multidrug resistance efflux pump